MEKGACENCNKFGFLTRQHVLHISQGGKGTIIKWLCSDCHQKIEKTNEDIVGILSQKFPMITATSGTLDTGIVTVNNRELIYEAMLHQGVSGSRIILEPNYADIRLYDTEWRAIGSGQVTRINASGAWVTGSPSPDSPIAVVALRWAPEANLSGAKILGIVDSA